MSMSNVSPTPSPQKQEQIKKTTTTRITREQYRVQFISKVSYTFLYITFNIVCPYFEYC